MRTQRFAHLFTPKPGKYNGHYGHINNRLHFSSPPPPNSKTRIPNYTPQMNKIMAEKMDELEAWGVLVQPESVGVTVEFVSPSMLVPKTEANEFRLVTDFAALNLYSLMCQNDTKSRQSLRQESYFKHFKYYICFYTFYGPPST